jgi:hypothetical protein
VTPTVDDIERICEIMTRYGATRVRLGSIEVDLPRAGAPVQTTAGTIRPNWTAAAELPTTMDELRAAVLPAPAGEAE